MERPRVLHIFLQSCQQELNNIIYLRIQIYVSVCPLKIDLGFYLFSPFKISHSWEFFFQVGKVFDEKKTQTIIYD